MKKLLLIIILVSFVGAQENERIIEKWSTGVVKVKHYYKGQGFDEELIGIKSYYKNGDLKWKSRYKNGKRHGEYSFYLPGNELLLKGTYVDGNEYGGEWYVYYPQEMFSKSGNYYFTDKIKDSYLAKYLNGTDFIVEVFFHNNGELSKYDVSYKSNIKIGRTNFPSYGKNYTWHENGMIDKIMEFRGKGDVSNFINRGWFDSGELEFEMESSDNMNTLKMTSYYKNGNIKSITQTIKGVRIPSLFYDIDGNIKY